MKVSGADGHVTVVTEFAFVMAKVVEASGDAEWFASPAYLKDAVAVPALVLPR